MMNKKVIQLEYSEFASLDELEATEVELINEAIKIAHKSYSPYSNFPVGASVLLDNGKIYGGNNQENIAYPSSTCADARATAEADPVGENVERFQPLPLMGRLGLEPRTLGLKVPCSTS